ncbi:MAG TPA: UDP-N-acetylmuramoyl-L-alanine--D-glutamate ligase, partial [Campylobacterales bacterium]|nr:UDP-N-acetylmuramoyl-L-alanine--D-glutamate ligase [Campylobacterales bacterium]
IRFKAAFLQDAILSLAITKTLFDEVNYDLINAFKLDNHRQEEYVDNQKRLWVNDSKATNVDATIQAIKTYEDRFIRLILGGEDKGADLEPLFELLADTNVHLYHIGANLEKVSHLAGKYEVAMTDSKTLENAVNQINQERDAKDVALLSPAAASFDQFNSYKHRGEEFFRFVKSI